jgi:uncharacterized membrane protein YdbT with pleckstrin-like domain
MADSNEKKIKSCPFCGEEILVQAIKCKHCGEFLDRSCNKQDTESVNVEKKEYEASPSMFRNHPFLFILCLFLIVAYGVGLLILLVWWIQSLCTTLTVTNKKTILRIGILSKNTSEVYHSDVKNVILTQTFTQRIFGVGSVGISSAGQSGIEIMATGIANPERVKKIIDKYRK